MAGSSHRRFEDVRALDDAALRATLAHDDPVERVWAVWGLALRASDGAVAVAEHLRGEPDAGVRRALAVVLAGHGHVDLLVALARHDPDVHVRAAGMTLVARLAGSGAILWVIVEERLRGDEAPVRAAIVAEIGGSAPAELRAQVPALLADGDRAVRVEAYEACLRVKRSIDVRDAVDRWVDGADDNELAMALARWRRVYGHPTTPSTRLRTMRSLRRAVRWPPRP